MIKDMLPLPNYKAFLRYFNVYITGMKFMCPLNRYTSVGLYNSDESNFSKEVNDTGQQIIFSRVEHDRTYK